MSTVEPWRAAEPWKALVAAIDAAEPGATDAAIAYLEADVYEFRSGYGRARVAGRLAQTTLSPDQQAWARRYVLDVLDRRRHCAQPSIARLAGHVADNALRRELRARFDVAADRDAFRALLLLERVRSPGLSLDQRDRARRLVLEQLRGRPWMGRAHRRLVRWLWDPAWADSLVELTRRHDPDRAGAKLILASSSAARRRWRPSP